MHRFIATLVLAGVTFNANAALLFDNGTDTSSGGNCSTCGPDRDQWQVFDDFTLTNNSVIKSMAFEAAIEVQSDITISIWTAPNSGQIYSETFSFWDLSPTRNTYGGYYDNYSLIAVLPEWSLSAGTYWISIFSEDMAVPNNHYINGSKQLNITTDTMYDRGYDAPFRLYSNTIPIPAAVWLFGSALAGLGWMRRRRAV